MSAPNGNARLGANPRPGAEADAIEVGNRNSGDTTGALQEGELR